MIESTLLYGERRLHLRISGGRSLGTLEPQTPEPMDSDDEVIRQALSNPIGSPHLAEMARGKKTAAILIPGKARRAGTQVYVPALIDELNRAGLTDDGITVFLADGTHVQHLESDIVDLMGADVLGRIRCLGHDCHDSSNLVELGQTQRGVPVFINRQVLDTDIKILTGRIVPHYFAGYSGGRKALIPGVAGFETIKGNHRLTLAEDSGIHTGVEPCQLDGNPVHEDLLEGARLADPSFCVNTILDTDHRIVAAVAGDFEAAHAAGCAIADRTLRIEVDQPADAVITCAGGLPYDSNFMQSLKAPFSLRTVVRPGGAMLWVAEAAGGMHDGFRGWAAFDSDQELNRAVRADYSLTGHNSIMLRQLVRHCRVGLVSSLPADVVESLGIQPFTDLDQGVAWLEGQFEGTFSFYLAPHANVLCAAPRESVG